MKCPKCKTLNDDSALVCSQCSFKLKLKCPNCGAYNTVGTKVCNTCNELLLKNCSVCGALNVANASVCRKCSTEFEQNVQEQVKKNVVSATLTFELINLGAMKNNFLSKDILLQKLINKYYQLFAKSVRAENQKPLKINEGTLTCEFKGYPTLLDSAFAAMRVYLDLIKKFNDINYALETKLHFSYKLRSALTTKKPAQKTEILNVLALGVVEDFIVGEDIVELLSTSSDFKFDLFESRNNEKYFKYIDKEKLELLADNLKNAQSVSQLERNSIFSNILAVIEEKQNGYIVVLNGQDGLGKSNILNSLRLAFQHEKSVFWLMGQCPLASSNTTLGFFKDLFRNLFDLPSTNIDIEASKDRVSAGLIENIGINDEKIIKDTINILFPDDEKTQKQIYENKKDTYLAISTIFKALLKNKKLILQIEDLENIDALSFDFLRELFVDGILDCNISILISANLELSLTEFFKVDSISNSNSNFIQISSLSKTEIDEFLYNSIRNRDILGENLLSQIYSNSKGLPIFIDEFLFALLQMGVIRYDENNTDKLIVSNDIENIQMPKTAVEIIKLRLTNISQANPLAFKALYYSSILGFKFVPAVLKNILEMENDAFGQLLSYLTTHNFIEPFDSFNYVFKNKVIWETIRNLDLKQDNKISSLLLTTNTLCKLSIPDMPIVIQNYKEAQLPAQDLLSFIEYAAKEAYVVGDDKAYVYYKDLLIETLKDTQIENRDTFIISIKEELGKLLYVVNPDKAITYLTELLDYYENIDVTKTLEILDMLSIAFENTGNYLVALECIDRALLKTNISENPLSGTILTYAKLEHILHLGRYEELNNLITTVVLPSLANKDALLQNEPSTLTDYEFKYIELDSKYLLGTSLALQGKKECIPILSELYQNSIANNISDFALKAQLSTCLFRVLQGNIKEVENILTVTKSLIPDSSEASKNTFIWYFLKNLAQFIQGNRENVKAELNMLSNFASNVKCFTLAPVIQSLIAKLILEEGDAETTQNTCYKLYCDAANKQWSLSALCNWYFCMDAYLYKEDYTSAITVGQKALDIAVKANIVNTFFATLFYMKTAEAYIFSGDFEMAKISLEQAYKISVDQEYYFIQAQLDMLIEQLLLLELKKNPNIKVQNIQEIYKHLCNAEKITEITQNHNMSIQIQEHLSNISKFAQEQGIKLI